MARRILWLGRLAGMVPRFKVALNEQDSSIRTTSLLGLLLGSVNFIVDDAITCDRMGVIPPGYVTPRTWQTAGISWFGGTVCAILLNLWQMSHLSTSPETKFQWNLAQVAHVKLLLDFGLNIPYAVGHRLVSHLPDGWFAFFGLASGLVSAFKIWVCAHHAETMEEEHCLAVQKKMSQTPPRSADKDSLSPDIKIPGEEEEEELVEDPDAHLPWYEIRRRLSSNRIATIPSRDLRRHSFTARRPLRPNARSASFC